MLWSATVCVCGDVVMRLGVISIKFPIHISTDRMRSLFKFADWCYSIYRFLMSIRVYFLFVNFYFVVFFSILVYTSTSKLHRQLMFLLVFFCHFLKNTRTLDLEQWWCVLSDTRMHTLKSFNFGTYNWCFEKQLISLITYQW